MVPKNMENFPLVSVIVPTHNRPDLVVRAVESVLKQTYPNIEIIVVDDASETPISEIFENEPKVKVLRNDVNKGGSFSRNKGIEAAKGYFVNFLDDDDIIFPKKIEKQVAVFQSSESESLGMVTCHASDHRSGEEITRFNRVRGNIYQDVLYKFLVSGIETMLFKMEGIRKIRGYDEELPANQEYDLLIRFSEFYSVDYVDEILSKEFRSNNQISQNFDKKINGAKHLYKKHNGRQKSQGILFWLKMKLKFNYLLFRFYIGKLFGEKWYRRLLFDK